MAVETRTPLKHARPEEVKRSSIADELSEAFDSRNLTSAQDALDKIFALNIISEIVEKDLSDAPSNPYALYQLRGTIASLLVRAAADLSKERKNLAEGKPSKGRIVTA
jgi:hypothetical protein